MNGEMTTTLEEALREAGEIVSSGRTLDRLRQLVQPGVYVKLEISVSVDNTGRFKLLVQSATHGTQVHIMTRKELQVAPVTVTEGDWAAAKRAVLEAEPRPALSADPRWKKDFE